MKITTREVDKEKPSSTVNIQWMRDTDLLMAGIDSRGTPVVIGITEDEEPLWRGLKATDMLLMSAASCSAYDVVLILKKQKENLEGLEVICSGQRASEPPQKFTHIHLKYILKGNLDAGNVEKAIQLSEDKYCSVINTLKDSVEFTSEYEIREGGE
jgi:putative redox protein